jgi:hypothetical protein
MNYVFFNNFIKDHFLLIMNNLQPVSSSVSCRGGLLWEWNPQRTEHPMVYIGILQRCSLKRRQRKMLLVYKQVRTGKLLYRIMQDYEKSDIQFFVGLWNSLPKDKQLALFHKSKKVVQYNYIAPFKKP